jgi:hypothetical protein
MKKFLLSVLLVLIGANAQANIVVNGDFTNNLSNWQTSPVVDPRQGTDYSFAATGTYGGGIFASFGYGNAPGGVLSQTLATVANSTYTLTFQYGALLGTNGQALEIVLRDTIGSQDLLVQAVADANPSSDLNDFLDSYTYTFTATSTATLLQFSDISELSFVTDGILDNVAVNVVPEPGSVALLGLGMLGLMAGRRKLRKNRPA